MKNFIVGVCGILFLAANSLGFAAQTVPPAAAPLIIKPKPNSPLKTTSIKPKPIPGKKPVIIGKKAGAKKGQKTASASGTPSAKSKTKTAQAATPAANSKPATQSANAPVAVAGSKPATAGAPVSSFNSNQSAPTGLQAPPSGDGGLTSVAGTDTGSSMFSGTQPSTSSQNLSGGAPPGGQNHSSNPPGNAPPADTADRSANVVAQPPPVAPVNHAQPMPNHVTNAMVPGVSNQVQPSAPPPNGAP